MGKVLSAFQPFRHRHQYVLGKVRQQLCMPYVCVPVLFNIFNSFHNKLKTTYLDGKCNRRVDYLLDTLMRMERDQFFWYMYKTQMLQSNPKDRSDSQCHERGLSIPITAVKVWQYRTTSCLLHHAICKYDVQYYGNNNNNTRRHGRSFTPYIILS